MEVAEPEPSSHPDEDPSSSDGNSSGEASSVSSESGDESLPLAPMSGMGGTDDDFGLVSSAADAQIPRILSRITLRNEWDRLARRDERLAAALLECIEQEMSAILRE